MSVHQIIYTSCRRGIHAGGDGMQVYAQDASFQGADGEELRHLFSYHPLDLDRPMTDELARAMPQTYKYQRLRSGSLALAQNTYLGRDYMGEGGRFGNHLSHVVICNPEDMTAYPAEYYGGDLLRSSMAFEEVNSPDPPPELPAPVLERSFVVTVSAVADFLAEAGRMEVYRQMLCATLSFGRLPKRVVILDNPEHMILWIAALGYALPRRNAMEVEFSTYEYAPALSPARVCGAVRAGTQLGDGGQHFLFDLLDGHTPALEPDQAFSEFIEDALLHSRERLWEFHSFLDGAYDYDRADEDIYGAYALYAALTDKTTSVPPERLALALDFAGRFAREEALPDLLRLLLPAEGGAEDTGIATQLLEAFAVDATRLTGMALALERFLLDRSQEPKNVWDCFGHLLLSRCPAGVEEAYVILSGYRRYDRIYPLYTLALSQAPGPEACEAVYETHNRALVQRVPEYANLYGKLSLEVYQVARSRFPETPTPAEGSIFKTVTNLFRRHRS